MEFVAKSTQRIFTIELQREIFVGREGETHSDAESFATDEHGSNTDKEISYPFHL